MVAWAVLRGDQTAGRCRCPVAVLVIPTPRRVSILRRHADLLVSGVCRSVLPVAARFAPVVSWSHGYRVQPRGEAGQEARRSPAQVRRDCAPPPGGFGGLGTHRWVGQEEVAVSSVNRQRCWLRWARLWRPPLRSTSRGAGIGVSWWVAWATRATRARRSCSASRPRSSWQALAIMSENVGTVTSSSRPHGSWRNGPAPWREGPLGLAGPAEGPHATGGPAGPSAAGCGRVSSLLLPSGPSIVLGGWSSASRPFLILATSRERGYGRRRRPPSARRPTLGPQIRARPSLGTRTGILASCHTRS